MLMYVQEVYLEATLEGSTLFYKHTQALVLNTHTPRSENWRHHAAFPLWCVARLMRRSRSRSENIFIHKNEIANRKVTPTVATVWCCMLDYQGENPAAVWCVSQTLTHSVRWNKSRHVHLCLLTANANFIHKYSS